MLPIYVELNIGETFSGRFGTNTEHSLTLLEVLDETEPLYENGKWYDIAKRSTVHFQWDGEVHTLLCMPYELPKLISGFRMEVDLTAVFSKGLHKAGMEKAARFAILPENEVWITEEFGLPMKDSRWRASNYMHTWNGFVHIVEGKGIYYHRGEDIGAVPNRHELLSAIDGVLKIQPPLEGDGDSNLITVDGKDIGVHYYHDNADRVERSIHVNDPVKKGQKLAYTGETWNNIRIMDPHLHMGISPDSSDVNVYRNCYSLYVDAYRRAYPEELLPIAGGYRFTRVNEPVTLSGEKSLPALNSDPFSYISFSWILTDGKEKDGLEVTCRYGKPGVYTEILKMTDIDGREAYDSVMVYVSDGKAEKLPFVTINTFPVRDVKAGTPVEYLIYPYQKGEVSVAFGDGKSFITSESRISGTHVWKRPGDYLLTVKSVNGPAEGIFRTVIRVS